jgi:hypothetical protein
LSDLSLVATFRGLNIQYRVIRAWWSPKSHLLSDTTGPSSPLRGLASLPAGSPAPPHPSTKNKSRAPHLTQNNSCRQQHMSKSHFEIDRGVLSLIPLLKRLSLIMRQDPCNATPIFPHTLGEAKRRLTANNRKFLHPIYFGSIPFHSISHIFSTVIYIALCHTLATVRNAIVCGSWNA